MGVTHLHQIDHFVDSFVELMKRYSDSIIKCSSVFPFLSISDIQMNVLFCFVKLIDTLNFWFIGFSFPLLHLETIIAFDSEVSYSQKPFNNIFLFSWVCNDYKLLFWFYYHRYPGAKISFNCHPISSLDKSIS
jgi:hypothetical protein